MGAVCRAHRMLRHTLFFLYLGQCNIDSNGACQLAGALCTNDTLQKLYLRLNPIEVKGAKAFAEILSENKTLKVLSLRDNSIGEEGTRTLMDSLTHNTTVKNCGSLISTVHPLPVLKWTVE